MKEVFGDAWELAKGSILFITTNGFVKKNGQAVMGRGIAKEASTRFPELPQRLGECLDRFGNHVFYLDHYGDYDLYSFPVKRNWWEKADLNLIKRSSSEAVLLISEEERGDIFLPRPGCGNGGLLWSNVKPLLLDLDERFNIVSYYE